MSTEKFESYILSKTWRRILARSLDIIIVSLFPILITLISYFLNKSLSEKWWFLLLVIFINFFLLFLYFVIIPWKFKGQSLGKKICFIKLIAENNKLTIKKIFYRESFLVFIPVTLTMLAVFSTGIIFNTNIALVNPNSTSGFWLNVLNRTIFSFVFAWYLGIMIVVKIDKKHQLFFDRKQYIYTVNTKVVTPTKKKEIKKDLVHVHLKNNKPGNISEDELKNIQDL